MILWERYGYWMMFILSCILTFQGIIDLLTQQQVAAEKVQDRTLGSVVDHVLISRHQYHRLLIISKHLNVLSTLIVQIHVVVRKSFTCRVYLDLLVDRGLDPIVRA